MILGSKSCDTLDKFFQTRDRRGLACRLEDGGSEHPMVRQWNRAGTLGVRVGAFSVHKKCTTWGQSCLNWWDRRAASSKTIAAENEVLSDSQCFGLL